MSSAEAAWLLGIDLAYVDRRFGAEHVNRLLAAGAAGDHAEPLRVDEAGRLVAALVVDPAPSRPAGRPGLLALHVRLRDDALEIACPCARGRFVCDHVARVLVDLAVHSRLRTALARRDAAAVELSRELPAMRRDALEERTLDERLAQWLPPRRFDEDLEIDVDVVRWAGLASAEERPALLLRHKRSAASRALVTARDVLAARLPPWHRRLVELTAPAHMDKNVLVSTSAQASMLLHLLRDARPIFTRGWKGRLRFGPSPVAPRIECVGDRVVARWHSAAGLVADAQHALLFQGPFPFLWSEAHEVFHPISPDVDLDVARGLSRVPSLPLSTKSAARIGRALLTRGRGLGIAMPAPDAFGLPPFERPSFELRLAGTPLDVRARLDAIYEAGRASVSPRGLVDAPPETRDVELEERALAIVRAAGFDADDGGELIAREDRAVDLWQHGIAALRASPDPRVAVLVAENLARVTVGPPVAVHVHVGVASGWLDTQVDFVAGALTVEMSSLRRALASRGQWVALSDGTLAKISSEVAALVDESATLLDAAGHGRLPAHHLSRLEQWIERFGGELDDAASEMRDRLRALAVREMPDIPSQIGATLRPYQLRGVAWLQFLRELGGGGILADDMGLGKTLMTLAFLARWKEDAGAAASLIVCPTSVLDGWTHEAKRFLPQLRVLVIRRGRSVEKLEMIEASDLVVTTYAVLRREVESFAGKRFRCVVLDEAQNIKNPEAQATRAARRLDAEMRLALSGTPIENRLGELWSIMSFVNPGMLGSRADFEARYEQPVASRLTRDVATELRALVRPFLLRRTKSDVLRDLPPKTEIVLGCVLGLRQKRLYDALALTLRDAVKKDIEKRGLAQSRLSVLTAILRLRQMACDPRLVDPAVPASESAKRGTFLELVRELVAEGRRALVFSQFVELLSLWKQDLDRERIAYEYLDGSSTNRQAIVDRFQHGAAPLFLVSLKAGGVGLNLTAADTVIHCDPWWNPAVEDQATDRAHRMGQTKPVTVVRLVAHATIEEKVAALKGQKKELASAILGVHDLGEAGALRGLTEEDIGLLLGGSLAGRTAPATVLPERRPRVVAERDVDDLRGILRHLESSGTPRRDLARRIGLPVARVSLLLIGHRVPISTTAADRIRALAR